MKIDHIKPKILGNAAQTQRTHDMMHSVTETFSNHPLTMPKHNNLENNQGETEFVCFIHGFWSLSSQKSAGVHFRPWKVSAGRKRQGI
jgi:hypothetical protein